MLSRHPFVSCVFGTEYSYRSNPKKCACERNYIKISLKWTCVFYSSQNVYFVTSQVDLFWLCYIHVCLNTSINPNGVTEGSLHVSCLYVPCRTEFVWVPDSHKYVSTGIHGQLKIHSGHWTLLLLLLCTPFLLFHSKHLCFTLSLHPVAVA